MKSDLHQIMARENIDVLWILGAATHNPAMTYFTGNVHVGYADLILKRGGEPVIFCNSMEREEAASSGLETINAAKYEFIKILEEMEGNQLKASAKVLQKMFDELGITRGRIAVYGKIDIGGILGTLKYLEEMMPDIEFIGEGSRSSLLEARATKDIHEIDRIRAIGKITTAVVGKTAALLQNCQVREDEVLLNDNGEPLTIGAVKTRINLWLAESGVENPLDCIFAIGRDAGIPHSAGTPENEIRLGKTIIYDIYPQEAGGGYFFDFTRTWCLGYAPVAETKMYEDVKLVYETIMSEMKMDEYASVYQDRTCDLFEAQGYDTIRQDSQLLSGYVHSLGHGLGLELHERPWFAPSKGQKDPLLPDSVVTIEPGLYYPEKGMGCRIEDSVWVRPDGKMEILAEYSYELVLPMKNWKRK
ncbi:MAG: aminopeptidase P family protein [Chloroflexi bacterium]|nr:aminopeptidase P family protein [Chloroflexota bacterium]